jgi:branched-chain amino acid transport system permease protein
MLVGSTGLVCFGHAAFFGIGAYATVLLSPADGPASLAWLLPAGVLLAGLYALGVGALSLRTKGVYFIMVTLAFAQMAYYVVHDTPLGGGTDGIYLNFKPALGAWSPLDKPIGHTSSRWSVWAGVCLVCWPCCCVRVSAGHSPASRPTSSACGRPVFRPIRTSWRRSPCRAHAGLAGFLFAVKDGFVNPELLSWHFSGAVLIMIILGWASATCAARWSGAFAFALLQEFFRSEAVFGAFAKHWHLGLGLTIIVSVAALPHGLVGLPRCGASVVSGATGADAQRRQPARQRQPGGERG